MIKVIDKTTDLYVEAESWFDINQVKNATKNSIIERVKNRVGKIDPNGENATLFINDIDHTGNFSFTIEGPEQLIEKIKEVVNDILKED